MEIKTKELEFHIQDKIINGITGNQLDNIISILTLDIKDKVSIDGKEYKNEEKYEYKKKIEIVEEIMSWNHYYKSVYEWMWYQMRHNDIHPKNSNKKIKDAIKIVGLSQEILNRGLLDCSRSEQKKIQIATALLSNPDMIILKEPFKMLDLNNQKAIKIILQKFAEKYDKKIIMISEDADILYQYTDYLIIYKNNIIIIERNTNTIYQDVDFLKRHRIDIPKIIEITYLARKNKNVKLDYHRDIRDIIKDIYKHMKR